MNREYPREEGRLAALTGWLRLRARLMDSGDPEGCWPIPSAEWTAPRSFACLDQGDLGWRQSRPPGQGEALVATRMATTMAHFGGAPRRTTAHVS